ncbi:MAG: phenylalanine--tRNA ligase subunit beta [Bacteroidales bacterium]|nr:phenylalanine--tRNA ligase subunit beta [Bacteroidales bacterium]
MKISYNWLEDYIELDKDAEELSGILTNIGLEVEGLEDYSEVEGGLDGIVIGEVLSCSKHPNADKLSCTTVYIGEGHPLNIVCGAPNVAKGQKVAVATVGTTLKMGENSFVISKTKIRGEVSEGMICAEDEMGLGPSHDGIMVLDSKAVPGTPAAEYFKLYNDKVFEIGLTPNRIDAASHFGTARDLAAYFSQHGDVKLNKPDISAFKIDNPGLTVNIEIEDTVGCRRFTGVTISDVKIKESPKWLKNKLNAIGLSPINNVVDITNFVLHETGQPLHAYDADKLNDKTIIVKRLKQDTPFITLDGVERKLSKDDVMVCDGKVPVCIAGVFGGLDSGVTENTKNVFLESAYFDPLFVRKTAKRHGLNTDSSFRFERGVDPENTLYVLKRAAILIKEIAEGKISSEAIDIHPNPVKAVLVDVLYSHVDRLTGRILDRDIIKKILISLDFEILKESKDVILVKVPPFRVDVTREADIIEEMLRIYGYNNIEFSEKLTSSLSYLEKPYNENYVNKVSEYFTDNGFYEIMSNSLTKSSYYNSLNSFPEEKLIHILNPLSADLNVLRQTLLFGGLEAIARNTNYKNPDLKLYEFGRVYTLKHEDSSKFESFKEEACFGLFITGKKHEQSWAAEDAESNFFQLKAYCLNMLGKVSVQLNKFKVRPIEESTEIFSGGLEYIIENKSVIKAGIINKKILNEFEIENEVYFAEIKWDELLRIAGEAKKFNELPKYPQVRRDLSLLIDEEVTFGMVEKIVFETERSILKKVNLFDLYKGKNIPKGKKSYAVSFFLQDINKTLTDKEIDRIMKKIADNLINKLKAELR